VPTVFLSYTHADKVIARSLVRRLAVYGVEVWIDERGLRLGDELTASIRDQIARSDVLLIVASEASAGARWVSDESRFAREASVRVIPFFIEPVAGRENFRDVLGIDASRPEATADAFHVVLLQLFEASGSTVPPADCDILRARLRELADEAPLLGPLIHGCLDGPGLQQESVETVCRTDVRLLDEALDHLFELLPTEATAYHLALGFARTGAAARALRSWIERTGDGGLPFANAVATELPPTVLSSAIELLERCEPPNDLALYGFIDRNASQFNDAQRRAAVRLATWPVRAGPGGHTDVLGWVAWRKFPDTPAIRQMWSRWIRDGCFDGSPRSPGDLAQVLVDAEREGLSGRDELVEELRRHVRGGLRSGQKSPALSALDHAQAAADAGASHLDTLLFEAEGSAGSAEWNDWRERDAATAEWTGWYLHFVVREARTDRNWLRALHEADRMTVFEHERQRLIQEAREGGPKGRP
jgi:hypothetical protein